jgi:hypothetical protein
VSKALGYIQKGPVNFLLHHLENDHACPYLFHIKYLTKGTDPVAAEFKELKALMMELKLLPN